MLIVHATSDLIAFSIQVKHFNIVDFSEAQALHLRAREKGKGREQRRLLELSSQKFEKAPLLPLLTCLPWQCN
jgi:hypothetical protein